MRRLCRGRYVRTKGLSIRREQDRSTRRLRVEFLEPRWCMALEVPGLASLPGADHTIYLDFDGHVTQDTAWNSYFHNSTIRSPAYSADGDASSFSAAELADIEQAWRRIAEDFLPFEVNVTTIDPGEQALSKSGGSDSQWGIRVVITADTERSGAGGIAYVDSFNWSSDTPAFVYVTTGKYIAEAASHEIGHTLGLAHDGSSSGEYYYGHGSGATSWAPIMGVGYDAAVTQWDQGEYTGATNKGPGANYGKGAADAAVITSYNGFGYRADDHGDAILSATALAAGGGQLGGGGIITTASDVDVFAFATAGGLATIDVLPASLGANLDIRADVLDSGGNLVAAANPEAGLGARVSLELAAGTYYLRIDGSGAGNPTASSPTGYTDYGSLGQYTISGQVTGTSQLASVRVSDVVVSESAGIAVFTISLDGSIDSAVSVDYSTGDDTALAGQDYAAASGSVRFSPGGPLTQTVSVTIADDALSESSERFYLNLHGPSAGLLLGDGLGVATIVDDDLSLSISDTSTREGSPNKGKKNGSLPQYTTFTFTVTLSAPAVNAVEVQWSTNNGTAAAGSDYVSSQGTVHFAPGEVSKTLSVDVVADDVAEPDEQFQVILSSPVGADVAHGVGQSTILDDDTKKGGGKPGRSPSGLETPSPTSAALLPVRDVFAWQAFDHDLDHHHDHDHDHAAGASAGRSAADAPLPVAAARLPARGLEATTASDSMREAPTPGPTRRLVAAYGGAASGKWSPLDEQPRATGKRAAATIDAADWIDLLAEDLAATWAARQLAG